MPHPNEQIDRRSRDDRSGWIYVLDNGMGHYKIGRTFYFAKRMKQLHVHLPFPVTVAYCFHDDDCISTEKWLHKKLSHRRLNGEWFALDIDDFAIIYELASYTGYWESRSGEFLPDPFMPANPDNWLEIHISDEIEDIVEKEIEWMKEGAKRTADYLLENMRGEVFNA